MNSVLTTFPIFDVICMRNDRIIIGNVADWEKCGRDLTLYPEIYLE